MVRTETVNLTVIPAIAYRQKLTAGGSGIVILRSDAKQPGIASLSKTSGEAIPTKNTQGSLYPKEAFDEAIALTAGLPYKKRSAPASPVPAAEIPEEKAEPAAEVVIDSREYNLIVDTYTDKNGKLSYSLLNKDMIKFAYSSSKEREMVSNKEKVEDIRLYIVGTKFRNITCNRDLSDDQVLKMVELLDEVSPKGVFKELNDTLRQMLKR